VPIVSLGDDPTRLRLALAQSLSRPGGNVTGITVLLAEAERKQAELLHEAVPTARRIALLTRRASVAAGATRENMIPMMANVGIAVRLFTADRQEEYPAAFAAIREAGMDALLIDSATLFEADFAQLQALAMEARLPTACYDAGMVRAGCLLSYGVNQPALRVRLAEYVASILRGTSPSEMPIEQVTQFEVAVNLRTARALGLTLPQTLLVRAHELIE
jgi:putative ABC transport system substrate-binding protein